MSTRRREPECAIRNCLRGKRELNAVCTRLQSLWPGPGADVGRALYRLGVEQNCI